MNKLISYVLSYAKGIEIGVLGLFFGTTIVDYCRLNATLHQFVKTKSAVS